MWRKNKGGELDSKHVKDINDHYDAVLFKDYWTEFCRQIHIGGS